MESNYQIVKKYLKKHIKYAKSLSIKINKDKNFELTAPQNLNMINFRFYPKNKNENNLNEIKELSDKIIGEIQIQYRWRQAMWRARKQQKERKERWDRQ